jgi:hypothetical protein
MRRNAAFFDVSAALNMTVQFNAAKPLNMTRRFALLLSF